MEMEYAHLVGIGESFTGCHIKVYSIVNSDQPEEFCFCHIVISEEERRSECPKWIYVWLMYNTNLIDKVRW